MLRRVTSLIPPCTPFSTMGLPTHTLPHWIPLSVIRLIYCIILIALLGSRRHIALSPLMPPNRVSSYLLSYLKLFILGKKTDKLGEYSKGQTASVSYRSIMQFMWRWVGAFLLDPISSTKSEETGEASRATYCLWYHREMHFRNRDDTSGGQTGKQGEIS